MTIDELRELAENERTRQKQYASRILYCSSAGCFSGGCESVKAELKKAIEEKGLGKSCELVGTGCLGLCGEGPLVLVQTADTTLYQHVDANAARRIVEEHIADGKKIEGTSDRFRRSVFLIAKENRARKYGQDQCREHRGVHRLQRI